MKMIRLILPLLLLLAPLQAAEDLAAIGQWERLPTNREGKLPPGWRLNSRFSEGSAALRGAGEAGATLQVVVPEGAAHPFHCYYGPYLPVERGGQVRLEVKVSGHGQVGAFVYVYDEAEKSLGMLPKLEDGLRRIDGSEELVFELPLGTPDRKSGAARYRLALVVGPGSNLDLQSLKITTP